VNSYGVEFGDRGAFAKLLRACGAIEGLERVRFTSPHPAAFTDDVIAAMAETPNVMPSLHMPLQSGSDAVLRAMRRSYRSEKFLGILDRVRAAMPDAAITTDIIVGFPGETDADFAETMRVVEQARFASAFMFQYSPRPGTPAATMESQIPKAVVQDRFERLQALQERISWDEAKAQVGRTFEVLIAEGVGTKDAARHRISGRAPDNRLVHVALPGGVTFAGGEAEPASLDDPRLADVASIDPRLPRPGDIVTVTITQAAPHHLIADSAVAAGDDGVFAVRRTRSGDAWASRERARLGGEDDSHSHGGGGAAAGPVSLGMPSLKR
ncbi:MAG: MiaB/RimO family radical SAM methylthiotransferase, partial [Cellulomonadaceae bacterium]|nr:MiaB/RimO family radical SAM methylthiotransferase [Cellulomonadaceae bacterium]